MAGAVSPRAVRRRDAAVLHRRALLARPRYLICDEISTMLDAVTQARIWNVVLRQAQEQRLGLVVVSHSAPLLQRLGTQVVDLEQLAEGR